jgi:hypothetical protein
MRVIDVVQKNWTHFLQLAFGSFAHWPEYLRGAYNAKIRRETEGVARSAGCRAVHRFRRKSSAMS